MRGKEEEKAGGLPPSLEISPEETRLKIIAELSCLTYQLTKIPIIRAMSQNGDPEEELYQTLRPIIVNATESEVRGVAAARIELFQKAQDERMKIKGDWRKAWQTEEWVWSKVAEEEIFEMANEASRYQGPLEPGLAQGIGEMSLLAFSGKKNWLKLLGRVFELASELGVKNGLNLFKFITEKQEGRISQKKAFLTPEDKEQEWQRLRPLAEKYFPLP